MGIVMILVGIGSIVLGGVCLLLRFVTGIGAFFYLAITFWTTAYHFVSRLLIGLLFQKCMRNHANYHRRWYRVGHWEEALYRALQIKRWKRYLPTLHPGDFDPRRHSWEEIAQTMCQAEVSHEVCAALSFLPVLAVIWLGELPVFLSTSAAAACIDLLFVMLQRSNRPRVLRQIRRQKERQS